MPDLQNLIDLIRDMQGITESQLEDIEELRERLVACCGEPDTGDTPDTGSTTGDTGSTTGTPAYLTFTSVINNSNYVGLETHGECYPKIFYSLDDGNSWTAWHEQNYANIPLSYRQTVKMYGDNPDGFSMDESNYARFVFQRDVEGGGELMALISEYPPEEIPNSWCFHDLFTEQMILVSPEMSATILKPHCYDHMFCQSSVHTPPSVLPADVAEEYSYSCMFKDAALTATTRIMASELKAYSCEQMYCSCDRMNNHGDNIHGLSATTVGAYCCSDMYNYCTGLTSMPPVPLATEMAPYCYRNMFCGCSGISDMTPLPATTLAEGCYDSMFKDCHSLTGTTILYAETMEPFCYRSMFESCHMLQQAPELNSTNLAESCYEQMFKGCENLSQAPALPATNLAVSCYANMFEECSSVTTIPALPATTLAVNCYKAMFRRAGIRTTEGDYSTYITLRPAVLAPGCYNNMFSGCWRMQVAAYVSSENCGSYSLVLPERACYQMFRNCLNLVDANDVWFFIEVSNIGESACESMFEGCTSLTKFGRDNYYGERTGDVHGNYYWEGEYTGQTDYVHFRTVVFTGNNCYKSMFKGCTSLKYLWGTYCPHVSGSLPVGCYESIFEGCENLQDVVYFNGWCEISLTNIMGIFTSDIPQSMGASCFKRAYYECFSLSKNLVAYFHYGILVHDRVLQPNCCEEMFTSTNVTSNDSNPTHAFVDLSEFTGVTSGCCARMFESTEVTAAKLPTVVTLPDTCYNYMFYHCSNLNELHCQSTPNLYALNSFINYTANGGTLYKRTGTDWTQVLWTGWTQVNE